MKDEATSNLMPETEIANSQAATGRIEDQDILIAAKGGGISFAGKLFEYLVRFVFSVIVARKIGAEQFGLYTLGLTVATIASNMALLGLQTGIVRFLPPAIRRRDDASIWGIIQVGIGLPALISLVFSVGLFLLAGPLAAWAFHDPRLVTIFRLISLSIPLDTLGFIAYMITISYKRPKYNVLANNIIAPLVKLSLTVGFLAIGMATLGVIKAQVIASAVSLGVMVFFVNSLFYLIRPLREARRNTGQLVRYSLPVHLGWMVNTVRGTLETLILGIVGLTTGVGVYAAAARLNAIGSMFYLSIANISTPIIADLYSRGQSSQLKAFYQTTTRWLVSFNIPLFLTFVLFARPLLSIFGADFTTGSTGLIILSIGTLVYTGTGSGANTLDMTDHTKVNMVNSLFMVVISIGLDLLLIPRWGVVGAAAASALSTTLINVVCLVEVWFLLHMQPYNWDLYKPFVAGLVTTVVTVMLNSRLVLSPLLHLIVGGIILGCIYAVTLIALGFSNEDLLVMNSLRSRFKKSIRFHGRLT